MARPLTLHPLVSRRHGPHTAPEDRLARPIARGPYLAGTMTSSSMISARSCFAWTLLEQELRVSEWYGAGSVRTVIIIGLFAIACSVTSAMSSAQRVERNTRSRASDQRKGSRSSRHIAPRTSDEALGSLPDLSTWTVCKLVRLLGNVPTPQRPFPSDAKTPKDVGAFLCGVWFCCVFGRLDSISGETHERPFSVGPHSILASAVVRFFI